MVSKTDILNFMTVGSDWEVIGSAADKRIVYTSDVDMQEFIEIKLAELNTLLLKFQNMFRIAKQNKDIYIVDFKCGTLHNNIAVRWDYDSIMAGIKDALQFVAALQQKSTIKLDVIAFIDGEFVEFSNNYYVTVSMDADRVLESFDDKTNDQVELSLMLDVQHYRQEHNYYKMLKRIMSVRKQKNQDVESLVTFFNGDVGQLNHILNSLIVIGEVMDNTFRIPSMSQIWSSIRTVKKSTPKSYQRIWKCLKRDMTYQQLRTSIDDIADALQPNVNAGVLAWLTMEYK